MRTASIIIACLAFAFTATNALAMTGAEVASMHKFMSQCFASGGKFLKVKLDVFECKYPNGSLQICSYAGPVGYCYGQEAPQGTGPTRQH